MTEELNETRRKQQALLERRMYHLTPAPPKLPPQEYIELYLAEKEGIEVARLAGLPSTVVNRAKKILRQLEEEAGRPAPAVQAQEDQVSLTALSEGEVIDQLRRAQVDTLSPLEALNLLYELKKKLN